MDQYIGKMLDNRYEILECIGTGGMAVVYKARCHRLNRLVAVKILKPELASDADFRRRFHDESQAVAMLSHANIVSVYDVSHSDGLDYIVMELIDGLSLKQYMQKRGTPLNWREALHFITQIVRALGHAHSRGIIHRDIKPHNIMVLRDGSVKVADFGIARLASAAQSTLTQEALGSVHYISPEQAKGSHVDGRSDLYSAGVVLYEMLTGRLPFEGETPVFVAIQHINSIPIPPRELNPSIPPALEAITMKAMAPNLDQRYSSADEMLEDLKEFRKNPGVIITPPGEDSMDEVDEPTMVVPITGLSDADKRPRPQTEQEGERAGDRKRRDVREEDPSEKEQEEGEDQEERPRRRGVPPILFAVLAILLFVGGVCYFLYTFLFQGMFAPVEEYTVPNLLGHTIEELEQDPTLVDGFEVVVGSTVYSEEYDEGQICEQTPEAGETVRAGSKTITVTLSGGQDAMYMKNVTGYDARQALALLQDEMHLTVKQEYEYSSTITEGYVISCYPIENTRLYEGDEVTIVISKGPEVKPVTVINFVGTDIEQVKDQLESLGLTMGTPKYYYSDEYPAGRVIWQSIDPGTQVDEGTIITFQVSQGPEPQPSATPEPTQTPEPSQAPVTTKTISVSVTGEGESVRVRITVGSTVWYNAAARPGDVVSVDVTASGEQMVYIYFDDVLVDSYSMAF